MAPSLRVLRLCSVFEPPPSALDGRGAQCDPIGGMQEHTGSLTRALDRRGVVQIVLTARPPTAPWVQRLSPRATVVRVSLPVARPRRGYALPAAVLAPLLARRADVVHVHLGEDLAILPLATLAARARRLPTVVTIHCSLTHSLQGSGPRATILRTLGGRLERRAVRRAAATLVYTERIAGLLTEDGGGSVQVMRRGIDRTRFAAADASASRTAGGRRRVVFVGRVVAAKGVGTLVEAAARLATPDTEVLIVGDGPDRRRVERTARRLGVEDRVRVTGFVPHERVPSICATADLLVLPSFYEELGTVLVEALHAGLPVVASRVGGIPEIVEDGVTGLLVAPGQPGALAGAIDTILSDRALAASMGASAARRAPEYDLERVGAEVHALYLRLASAASAGRLRREPAADALAPTSPSVARRRRSG